MSKKRKIVPQKHKPASHKTHDKVKKTAHKTGKPQAKPGSSNPQTHARDLEPTIPFSPEDSILLIGEGDLSFSRALVEHHYCENVTATVLEKDLEALIEKYPHVKENVELIEAEGSKVAYGVDAKKMGPWAKKSGKDSVGIMDRISVSLCPHRLQNKVADHTLAQYSTSPTWAARAQMLTARYGTTRSCSSNFSRGHCSRWRRGEPSSSPCLKESRTPFGTSVIWHGTRGYRSSEASASRPPHILDITTRERSASSRTNKETSVVAGRARTAWPGAMSL